MRLLYPTLYSCLLLFVLYYRRDHLSLKPQGVLQYIYVWVVVWCVSLFFMFINQTLIKDIYGIIVQNDVERLWQEPAYFIGMFLFGILLNLAWLAITFYAFGMDLELIKQLAWGFLMYVIFPGAMLFFIGALSWVIYQGIMNPSEDIPWWGVIVAGFFDLILILVLPVYIKMTLKKEI